MDIINKTKEPIRIPLSGGKRLFLSPGGLGQISPKAAEQPAVKALIDDGSIEIRGGGSGKPGGSKGTAQHGSKGGPTPGGSTLRHTGDR